MHQEQTAGKKRKMDEMLKRAFFCELKMAHFGMADKKKMRRGEKCYLDLVTAFDV